MKIAIIGAGFSGLAVAWHLIQQAPDLRIEIFDSKGIGGGASGIAAGLLHPFGGAHSKLNWMGWEGYHATRELIAVASQALGSPVAKEGGLIRPAITEQQRNDFSRAASLHSEISWLSAEECQSRVPGMSFVPSIFIKNGITIYAKQYLNGLWKACSSADIAFISEPALSLSYFSDYKAVVLAIGADIALVPEASSLPLKLVKGQVLEFAWPPDLPPISIPLNSQAYLLMGEDGITCLAGATYERDFIDDAPDEERARQEILPKILSYYPFMNQLKVIGCYAGVRVSTPDHRPITDLLQDNIWVITGMGSKGLLYHVLAAKKIAASILAD